MPELGQLKPASLPEIHFQPINPETYFQAPPAPLPPSTAAASAALGQAGILSAAGDAIAKLPSAFQNAYSQGQQQVLQTKENQGALAGLDLKNKVMSGKPLSDDEKSAMLGLSIGPNGQSTYAPPSPLEQELNRLKLTTGQAQLPDIAAQTELRKAQALKATSGIRAYQNVDGLYNGNVGAPDTRDGSVFGLVPDGKGGASTSDPNDSLDAAVPGFDKNKGAWGANIKDPNLAAAAVTPDDLKNAGVDMSQDNVDGNGLLKSHVARVTDAKGVTHDFPIADKLGTAGRTDFTLPAYRQLGGPETKGGGIIPKLKVAIVPTGAPAPGSQPHDPGVDLPEGWSTKNGVIASPDGTRYVQSGAGYRAYGPDGVVRNVNNPKYPPVVQSYQQMTGMKPKLFEPPQDYIARAANYIHENSFVPPGEIGKQFESWQNNFEKTPEAKSYLLAREASDKVNSALQNGGSVNPAEAITTMDDFAKYNSGRGASVGMVKLNQNALTLKQKIETWFQGLTGDEKSNAKLTPQYAKEMQDVLSNGVNESRKRLDATLPGETARWQAKGVGPLNVQNRYKTLYGESPVTLGGAQPVAPAPVVAPAAPVSAPVAAPSSYGTKLPVGMVKMKKPDGSVFYLPSDKVDAAIKLGATQG